VEVKLIDQLCFDQHSYSVKSYYVDIVSAAGMQRCQVVHRRNDIECERLESSLNHSRLGREFWLHARRDAGRAFRPDDRESETKAAMVQSPDHSLWFSFLRVERHRRLIIHNEGSQSVWKHVRVRRQQLIRDVIFVREYFFMKLKKLICRVDI